MSGSGQESPRAATSPVSQVSSTVTVSVDPETAFAVFTGELDLWWVRGPTNHYAAGRVLAMRCEPGVGGRLLEVYDDATVRVVATIPVGGQDRGGTAWVRVVPKWFGPWCARRDHEPHEVRDLARLALAVSYARPAAAARWLADVFGFASPDPLPEGHDPLPETAYGHPWIEFWLGNSALVISKLEQARPEPACTHLPWVYVDDVESHYQHARAGGATIVTDLASPWGLPFYVAEDCENNRWTFAQARPTMR